MEKLVAAAFTIALAVLDAYLETQINRIKEPTVRETVRRVEDEVMRLIAGPIGEAIAREVALRATRRWFPNDPSTGIWG